MFLFIILIQFYQKYYLLILLLPILLLLTASSYCYCFDSSPGGRVYLVIETQKQHLERPTQSQIQLVATVSCYCSQQLLLQKQINFDQSWSNSNFRRVVVTYIQTQCYQPESAEKSPGLCHFPCPYYNERGHSAEA